METSRGTDIGATAVLTQAATAAGRAPSIHNTQPWRWRIGGTVADLYADTGRWLRVGDPDRRMLTISCGAALHHARVALAATGTAVTVDLLPTVDDFNHLARVTVTGHVPTTDAARAVYDAIGARRTDRRPLLDVPLTDSTLRDLRRAAETYDVGFHLLGGDEVAALAAGTEQAGRVSRTDPAARTELDAWVGDEHRPAYAGIPPENLPNRTPPTLVPARDFGHVGTLATAGGHDSAATYVILYGRDDTPVSWLRAGEALSAIWLAATERDIAVLPLSAAVEHQTTRSLLERILAGRGHPAIAVRLGTSNPNQPVVPPTPRLPATATIDVV
jgi:nitroreductase